MTDGAFSVFEGYARSIGLWNSSSSILRCAREKWEGKTEEELTFSFASFFSLEMFGEKRCVSPIELDQELGDILVVRREYADRPRLLELKILFSIDCDIGRKDILKFACASRYNAHRNHRCRSFAQIRSSPCLKRSVRDGTPSRCFRNRVVMLQHFIPAATANTAQGTSIQRGLSITLSSLGMPGTALSVGAA